MSADAWMGAAGAAAVLTLVLLLLARRRAERVREARRLDRRKRNIEEALEWNRQFKQGEPGSS